jgi:hypothetical protein
LVRRSKTGKSVPETTLRTLRHKKNAEESVEWQKFSQAIQSPRPAIEVFTGEALMFLYLMLGEKALK